MRIGHGYDAHRLVAGRPLVLGGVAVPFDKGLLGHSDADVLVHAVCDALLGAAGLGDLGRHFPDSDPRYKGAGSLGFLKEISAMLAARQLTVANVDATVTAQAPKLAPYRRQMIQNIATAIGIDPSRVNVKATTSEGLGFAGRQEGMAAASVVLLTEPADRAAGA